MRFSIFVRAVLVASVGLAGSAVSAQTPFETVCAPLHPSNGVTPGLFGLCVAYCVAQECNALDVPECGPELCSCSDVLDDYNDKRQPGDPAMPCIQEECPCFDAQFLADELSNPAICIDGDEQTLINGSDPEGCINAVAQVTVRSSGEICQAFAQDRDPADNVCKETISTLQSVSPDEFAACQSLLRTHQGLTCP